MAWLRTIIRFTSSTLLLLFLGYILPGYTVLSFSAAVIGGFFLAGLGFLSEVLILKKEAPPYFHGLAGFITALVGIFLLQLFLPGVRISWLGILITALIIGLTDLIVPTTLK